MNPIIINGPLTKESNLETVLDWIECGVRILPEIKCGSESFREVDCHTNPSIFGSITWQYFTKNPLYSNLEMEPGTLSLIIYLKDKFVFPAGPLCCPKPCRTEEQSEELYLKWKSALENKGWDITKIKREVVAFDPSKPGVGGPRLDIHAKKKID